MTFREMLDLLKSKGVHVNEDRRGYKLDGDHEFLKFWMVRTRSTMNPLNDTFFFACGFDMLEKGQLVISHKEYPVDENILDSINDAIKRNYGYTCEPDDILLMPDLDYYDTIDAEKEKE